MLERFERKRQNARGCGLDKVSVFPQRLCVLLPSMQLRDGDLLGGFQQMTQTARAPWLDKERALLSWALTASSSSERSSLLEAAQLTAASSSERAVQRHAGEIWHNCTVLARKQSGLIGYAAASVLSCLSQCRDTRVL